MFCCKYLSLTGCFYLVTLFQQFSRSKVTRKMERSRLKNGFMHHSCSAMFIQVRERLAHCHFSTLLILMHTFGLFVMTLRYGYSQGHLDALIRAYAVSKLQKMSFFRQIERQSPYVIMESSSRLNVSHTYSLDLDLDTTFTSNNIFISFRSEYNVVRGIPSAAFRLPEYHGRFSNSIKANLKSSF